MKIKEKYLISETGLVIDKETGEEFSTKEFIELIQLKQYEDFEEITKILCDLNIGLRYTIKKIGSFKHNVTSLLKGESFKKVMDYNLKELKKIVSPYSYMFFTSLIPDLDFPTNIVSIDGMAPTNEYFEKQYEIGNRKLQATFKELEYVGAIKRVKTNIRTSLYINPFIVNSGLVDENTVDIFKYTVFNPNRDKIPLEGE